MSKKHTPDKEYSNSWYAVTSNRLLATLGALKGEINCDVCVIGGGFTGLSSALELAQKGYSVILLEAKTVGSQASGKNGGHLLRGYSYSPTVLTHKYDLTTAKMMCNLTLEGLAQIIERINKYSIKCDLKFGHVTGALNKEQSAELKKDIHEWEKIGHPDLQYLNKKQTQEYVKTKSYVGGLYDPKGAHFHPLNYALGLAQAAQAAGCKIYDETPALAITHGEIATVKTPHGKVKAKFVVIGGYIDFKGTEKINKKVIAATAHMIATEPLGEEMARKLLPKDSAVTDASFIMNYYRLSGDRRMLFGGNCNYSGRDYKGEDIKLKERMVGLFPELSHARIDHCWHGSLDITLNRMPHFGRLAPNVFYAHGYSGHGLILSNIAGRLMAEAVSGTAERFDVFTRIKHVPFMGGDLLKRPLFVLGMTWFKIKDMM
jgi:gamma-glutamylputrescine oxidase